MHDRVRDQFAGQQDRVVNELVTDCRVSRTKRRAAAAAVGSGWYAAVATSGSRPSN